MTDLSPAQKIVAAFNERYELCGPLDDDWVEQCLAAAFPVAADQVVPEDPCGNDCCITTCEQIHADFLAIAAELETTTDTP